MKILYIDPEIHTPNSRVYEHYNYLFDQVAQKAECFAYRDTQFDNILTPLNAARSAGFEPDVIFFGMGWFALSLWPPCNLQTRNIDIPCVGFLYKPQNFLDKKIEFLKSNNFDLVVTSVPAIDEYQEKTGIQCALVPQAGDPAVFYDRGLEKVYDIGFSGALHDNKHYVDGAFKNLNVRSQVQDILKSQKGITTFLNGSDTAFTRILSYEEYAKKINEAKVWIATPAPFEEVTGRYFEIGMSKTLILCSEIPAQYRDILIDGVTCVTFEDDVSNFLEKFYHYLNNWEDAQSIIDRTYDQFHEHHTWERRASTLLELFRGVLK